MAHQPFPGYDQHAAAAQGQPKYVQDVYDYCKTPEHTKVALEALKGSKQVTDQMRENDESTEKKQIVQARIDAGRRKAAEEEATAADKQAAAEAEAKKERVDAERNLAEAERKAKIEAAKGGADVAVAEQSAAATKQNARDAASSNTRTSRESSPRRRGRAAATPSTGSFPTGPGLRRPGLLPRVEGRRRRARAHRAALQEDEDQGRRRRRQRARVPQDEERAAAAAQVSAGAGRADAGAGVASSREQGRGGRPGLRTSGQEEGREEGVVRGRPQGVRGDGTRSGQGLRVGEDGEREVDDGDARRGAGARGGSPASMCPVNVTSYKINHTLPPSRPPPRTNAVDSISQGQVEC